MSTGVSGPKILATGFGPFPGAAENPTAALVACLAEAEPESLGASALRTVLLPTDYKKSWAALRRLYAGFRPDVVVHFGLSARAEAIRIERLARRQVRTDRPDLSGFAPRSGRARRSGPDTLSSNLPADALVAALQKAGFPASVSDHAGAYVCNATLYRSLLAAEGGRLVGFVHVPPEGKGGYTCARLCAAAGLILAHLAAEWVGCRPAALSNAPQLNPA